MKLHNLKNLNSLMISDYGLKGGNVKWESMFRWKELKKKIKQTELKDTDGNNSNLTLLFISYVKYR